MGTNGLRVIYLRRRKYLGHSALKIEITYHCPSSCRYGGVLVNYCKQRCTNALPQSFRCNGIFSSIEPRYCHAIVQSSPHFTCPLTCKGLFSKSFEILINGKDTSRTTHRKHREHASHDCSCARLVRTSCGNTHKSKA